MTIFALIVLSLLMFAFLAIPLIVGKNASDTSDAVMGASITCAFGFFVTLFAFMSVLGV